MSKVEEKPVLTHEQAKDFMFDELMTRRQKREAMILYHRLRIAYEMRGFLDPMELIHKYDDLMKFYFGSQAPPQDEVLVDDEDLTEQSSGDPSSFHDDQDPED